MSGERFSVRLPRRMVPIWVSEPTGLPLPRRACSTPLMNVEDGTEADEQDAKPALCRLDRGGLEFDEVFCFQDHTSLAAKRHERHLPLRGHPPCPRPVFDCALPLAEQGGQSALTAEAPDDPLGGVRFLFHSSYPNKFFVMRQEHSGRRSIS